MAVAGDSLRGILTSGVKGGVLTSGVNGGMERAMALLAKRSEAARTGSSSVQVNEIVSKGQPDSGLKENVERSRVEIETVSRSSMEEIGLQNRKRGRGQENEDAVPRRVLNRTVVGVGSDLPPIIQPVKVPSSVRVEVSPHQRWTSGSSAPTQVFQVFDLPQDVNAYANKTRAEIAERCLTRGGRFFADLMHVVNSYRSGGDAQESDRLARELAEVQLKILDAEKRATESEKRAVESEKRETEAAKRDFGLRGKLEEENRALKDRVANVSEELKQSKAVVEVAQKRCEELEAEINRGRKEISELKVEVEKGIAAVADAIGVGYDSCYKRVVAAGINLAGHSFDDYCNDLAKATAEKAVDTPAQA